MLYILKVHQFSVVHAIGLLLIFEQKFDNKIGVHSAVFGLPELLHLRVKYVGHVVGDLVLFSILLFLKGCRFSSTVLVHFCLSGSHFSGFLFCNSLSVVVEDLLADR
jgi:hypothetical protein